ncbi:MAG: PDZ domain-containing protein [Nitrospinae bacterium]|nr:PDZ domain-containing protein [Nitrospinota bacterium]
MASTNKFYFITPLIFIFLGCATQGKKETPARPEFPLELPMPKEAGSALDFQLKPRASTKGKKGWLGIFMGTPDGNIVDLGGRPEEKGVRVDYLVQGSPAEKGGFREKDVIVSIGEAPLSSLEGTSLPGALKKKIEEMGDGAETSFTVLREGKRTDMKIVLGSPIEAVPVLKPHPELEENIEGPSILEKTLSGAGVRDAAEKILDRIRERSYEAASYKLLFTSQGKDPFRLGEVDYLLHFPMRGGPLAKDLSQAMQKKLKERGLLDLLAKASDEIDVPIKIPEKTAGEHLRDFGEYIKEWKSALCQANRKINEAFSRLTEQERKYLYDSAPDLLYQEPDAPEKEPTEEEQRDAEENLLKFLKPGSMVDYEKLFSAFVDALGLVDLEYFDYLRGMEDRIRELTAGYPLKPGRAGVEGEVLLDEDTESGRIIIGGPGRNVYTADAALIIDLGGDDIHLNSAGGSSKEIPFSICIDLKGNDVYRSSRDFSQGSGRMGMGVLIDLEGDDIYDGKNYSQGTGFLGLGILYDEKGNDHYSGNVSNQGAGFFGCGLLLDAKGDDSYKARLYSQGFGMVKGFGAIVDGEGEDLYFAGGKYTDFREPGKAYQSMSQGFGFGFRPFKTMVGASGGIGLLSDGGGNDTYIASYFSQGSSYWYGLGILADESGHDFYQARRYSQGTGVHRSIGILWDGAGDDQYLAGFGVSQGCGHDESVGILQDDDGSDLYQGGALVQGAGNAGGLGVLLDKKGADVYYNRENSQGWGDGVNDIGGTGSLGILMDLGGSQDQYSREGKNNSARIQLKWGILLDGDPEIKNK